MSARRARSPDSVLEGQGETSADQFDDEDEGPYSPPPPARQTSVRLSRRADGGARLTASRQGSGRLVAETSRGRQASAGRRRAPTPIVRRSNTSRRRQAAPATPPSSPDEGRVSVTDEEVRDPVSGRRRRRVVAETNRKLPGDGPLSWYERMMPDFVLNMTAPITGYESRLDSDVEEDEYEILERQRQKRNRRVRRRLLGLLLVGAAVGAFMYSRGRMCQKMGVKAALSQVKHRMEDGLARSIQDTMGK